jgi:putative drug exporter of the RND superfamily
MATKLQRLGRWSFDHRRIVLSAWLLALVGVVACAMAFKGQIDNKFEVPGTESQQAQKLLEQKYPEASGTFARVVFAAPEGHRVDEPQYKAAVMDSVERAKGADEVQTVIDPYSAKAISKDGRIAYADVIYPVPASEIGDTARDELAGVGQPAEKAGLQVEYGGGIATDGEKANSESVGMMVAFLVLAITLGSLVAAGLPLITALLGVGIGVTGLTALSGVIQLSDTAPTLATMLGLAVGIDYALFILSRHRENLANGMSLRDSVANATATAGSAVVFAGTTVVIALVGLTVVNIPFLTVMGLAAAGTVSIAVLIAITLLPALLGVAGMRVTRINRVLGLGQGRMKTPLGRRWVGFVTKRPVPVLIAGLAILCTVALPALHMRLGLPDGGSKPTSMTERRSYDLLTEGFGPGFNGTLTVVVDAPEVARDEQQAFAGEVAKRLQGFDGVTAVSPPMQNKAGDLTVVSVTPDSSPSSDATTDLVKELRATADSIPKSQHINAYVTGQTATNIDTADRLSAALPRYVLVVVGLALLLMMVVFRSLLIPLKAAAGFLLSIGASMGLVVWVFQDGHLGSLFNVAEAGPIVSFLPILLIGILFGLAMDYEVFLVSRMREAFVHTGDAPRAVVDGYSQTARVVTAAATIMIAVFGAFVLDPDPILKSIGLSLAFGVLADAFLVRLTLVPAVMALMGKAAWWMPKRLDSVVPHLDIEGAKA